MIIILITGSLSSLVMDTVVAMDDLLVVMTPDALIKVAIEAEGAVVEFKMASIGALALMNEFSNALVSIVDVVPTTDDVLRAEFKMEGEVWIIATILGVMETIESVLITTLCFTSSVHGVEEIGTLADKAIELRSGTNDDVTAVAGIDDREGVAPSSSSSSSAAASSSSNGSTGSSSRTLAGDPM